MKYVNCTVANAVPNDHPFLQTDSSTIGVGVWESASRVRFSVPDTCTGGFTIYFNNSQQHLRDDSCVLPADPGGQLEGPVLQYRHLSMQLTPADDGFVDVNGNRRVVGLASDFRLLQMYLHGEHISGIIAERVDAGAQGFRVFGTCDFLFSLDPRDFPTYYELLREFAEELQARGLYLHFTALTDCNKGPLQSLNQNDHWVRCSQALAEASNVIVLELANEYWQNGVVPSLFRKATPLPYASVGSFPDGSFPPASWGDISCFHPRRDHKWWYTVPATAQEIRADSRGAGKPVWIGEPIGAAEQAAPGSRDNNPGLFEKLGAGIGIFAAGGVFHSEGGLRSSAWTSTEQLCAQAFFRGLHR